MRFESYKKNGKRNRKQRYKCHDCGFVFENKRRKSTLLKSLLWHEYVYFNRGVKSLSRQYRISGRSIRKLLDESDFTQPKITVKNCILIMDTCYFRRGFGVMIFRDYISRRNMFWKFVNYETLAKYRSGIDYLISQGLQISGIVCDGKRGLLTAFGPIPMQMCQFHQVAIITRYITRSPKLQAGIELKSLMHKLTKSSRTDFNDLLNKWYNKWKDFLSEKTYEEETGKWHYTHGRLRSAYRSLKTNMPYLFTYLECPDLDIPNTTNSLEGFFSNLKTKLRVHSGIKECRKRKVINEILSK